jgi:hypothetical protein
MLARVRRGESEVAGVVRRFIIIVAVTLVILVLPVVAVTLVLLDAEPLLACRLQGVRAGTRRGRAERGQSQ